MLAAQFVSGPQLFAPVEAEQRFGDWLADLAPDHASAFRAIIDECPQAKPILLGIAEASPFLFDLIRADAARALRLLQCDPEAQLATLIAETSANVAAAGGDPDVMHLLRRMKSEAALLIALCDIGGVWPVMRVTRGLTDLATASVQSALRYLLRQEVARKRILPPD
eukprot:gene2888-3941_t